MHVGIIMDGNGRWAQRSGYPRKVGHEAGAKALCRAIEDVADIEEIDCATFYAFSTENDKRNDEEVSNILGVIAYFLSNKVAPLAEKYSLKIRFIGDISRLPSYLTLAMSDLNAMTINNNSKTIVFAIGYGGDEEVLHAVNKIFSERVLFNDSTPITKEELYANLYTAGLPLPDIIYRYGGYKRLSNFLPLQSVYSELFFTDKFWPDYEKSDLENIIKEFLTIKRNFGGLNG